VLLTGRETNDFLIIINVEVLPLIYTGEQWELKAVELWNKVFQSSQILKATAITRIIVLKCSIEKQLIVHNCMKLLSCLIVIY